MKLVSKKNGTTTIFPSLISAIASKIGFTPPTGMSATNVQDAIEEVNGRIKHNNLSAGIVINTYNSSSNAYTFPSDGYLVLSTSAGTSNFISGAIVSADGSRQIYCNISGLSTSYGAYTPVFVRKGMKYFTSGVTGSASAVFYPLS